MQKSNTYHFCVFFLLNFHYRYVCEHSFVFVYMYRWFPTYKLSHYSLSEIWINLYVMLHIDTPLLVVSGSCIIKKLLSYSPSPPMKGSSIIRGFSLLSLSSCSSEWSNIIKGFSTTSPLSHDWEWLYPVFSLLTLSSYEKKWR